eukprot:COSAG06_NODE_5030_length_3777_cov_4.431485_4_plen_42_part_00
MIIIVKESSKCDLVICQTKLQIVAFLTPILIDHADVSRSTS